MIVALRKHEGGRRGAMGTRVSLADRWRSLVFHHRTTLRDSLKRMLREPMQSLLTTVVIAIAFSLPTMLYLIVDNVRQLESGFESSAQISVYVDRRANQRAISLLQNQLQALPEVASVTYISAEQALKEFQNLSGFGSALQHLENNPLPAVFLVEPKMAVQITNQQTERLLEKINQLPIIDDVQIDMLWLQRLRGLIEIGRKSVIALGTVLGLGVLLIVGNTIRLAIQARREEIVIIKLVGGTDAYVRRPFLYGGMLLGIFGAFLSSLSLFIGIIWLDQSISLLSDLYSSQYQLHGLGLKGYMILMCAGAFLGICGARLAVGRHLREIKPR